MGKAEENKLQKKLRLIDTAFNLFTTKGLENTSISDISSSAGVGKGTFYLYFKDKNDLYARLISRRADQLFVHAVNALKEVDQENMAFEDKIVFITKDVIGQLKDNVLLLKFIQKNLSWGVFRSTISNLVTEDEFESHKGLKALFDEGMEEWDQVDLLLYTIVELTGATCYSVILHEDPVPLDVYEEYLEKYIKSVIQLHRKK